MKLLVVLLAILFGVWLWRRGHRIKQATPQQKQLPAEPMIACARCGVHVPRSSSVQGRRGHYYCCAAHQQQAEGS